MTQFRTLLWALFGTIGLYTAYVVITQGAGFLSIFMSDLVSLTWRGQFNLDFALYLSLSALWIAWREQVSARGLVMAACAGILGMIVLAPYLLWASAKAGSDIQTLLLGKHARR